MTTNSSRFGAVAAFVSAGLMWVGIVSFFLPIGLFRIAFEFLAPILIIVVFSETKSLFNSRGFRAADTIIVVLMAVVGLSIVFNTINGGFLSFGNPSNTGPLVYLAIAIYVVWFALGVPLGIQMLRFGRLGGGIWTATAILYFIVAAFFVGVWATVGVAVALGASEGAQSMGEAGIAAIYLMLPGAFFLLPPTMICHGIALLSNQRNGSDIGRPM